MPTTDLPTTDRANTHAVFKAYDVRGTVPDQLDEELARRTGAAFVEVMGASTVVVGHDMRPSSPALAVHVAQVVGVRLGVGRERTDHRRLVGVDVGERGDRRAAARGARTAPGGTHGADGTSGAAEPG